MNTKVIFSFGLVRRNLKRNKGTGCVNNVNKAGFKVEYKEMLYEEEHYRRGLVPP